MPYKVAIIMGSDSDLNVMKEAAIVLEHFEIPYLISIVSAHRTPKRMYDFVTNKTSEGLQVFIAGAGGAAGQGSRWTVPRCRRCRARRAARHSWRRPEPR